MPPYGERIWDKVFNFTQVIRIFALIYALLCSQKDKIRDKNNSTII